MAIIKTREPTNETYQWAIIEYHAEHNTTTLMCKQVSCKVGRGTEAAPRKVVKVNTDLEAKFLWMFDKCPFCASGGDKEKASKLLTEMEDKFAKAVKKYNKVSETIITLQGLSNIGPAQEEKLEQCESDKRKMDRKIKDFMPKNEHITDSSY